MKRKIGLFLDSPRFGGIYQYNLSILQALQSFSKDEYEIYLAYYLPPPGITQYRQKKAWHDDLKSVKVKKIKLSLYFRVLAKFCRVLRIPKKVWKKRLLKFEHYRTYKQLHAVGCDLWLFPSSDPIGYRYNLPSLVTIHDLMHIYEGHFQEISPREYRIREHRYLLIVKHSLGIIVDSSVGKQHMMESYNAVADKIFSLPYIPPYYIYQNSFNSDIGSKYKLPVKYIYYPAQFWFHKNHKNLLLALYKSKKQFPNIHLVLTGDKKIGLQSIESLTEDLDLAENVTFLGYVSNRDLVAIFRQARMLIFPSFYGPTNIPPLEAFVLGIPSAVSNIYGMPNQVGDASLLFDPNSVDELANCIVRLWSDDELCKQLIERGYQRSQAWGPLQYRRRLEEIIDHTCENLSSRNT